ncbi:20974_t:CDS:2, partial [Gigaspora rosea]
LHRKTLTFVAVSELDTLEEAIISARRVEAALNEKCPKEYQSEWWEKDKVYTLGENRHQPYLRGSRKVAQGRPESR